MATPRVSHTVAPVENACYRSISGRREAARRGYLTLFRGGSPSAEKWSSSASSISTMQRGRNGLCIGNYAGEIVTAYTGSASRGWRAGGRASPVLGRGCRAGQVARPLLPHFRRAAGASGGRRAAVTTRSEGGSPHASTQSWHARRASTSTTWRRVRIQKDRATRRHRRRAS